MQWSRKKKQTAAAVLSLALILPLLSGCQEREQLSFKLSQAEQAKVSALLGDLEADAADSTRKKLEKLIHRADRMRAEREGQGDYEMSEKEQELWTKITALLDKETIRQFGEAEAVQMPDTAAADHGAAVLERLKSILSEQDWDELSALRHSWMEDDENEDEPGAEENDAAGTDTEAEIKRILNPYPQLDVQAAVLNLMEEKGQKSLAVFKIQQDLSVRYQAGTQSGLNEISEKKQLEYQQLWETVRGILPDSVLEEFRYFRVVTDGAEGTYAYVLRLDDTGRRWSLSVDPVDVKEDGMFPYSVVHEIAHYLSLNEQQVDYFGEEWEAYPKERYSDSECAARENSYLQAYYSAFWQNIIDDWAVDPENIYFYWRHESELATPYAVTECAEDFAESFSGYVLEKKAKTPKLQKKYDFFAAYPELRQLKKDILSNIKVNQIYVNPHIEPEQTDAA